MRIILKASKSAIVLLSALLSLTVFSAEKKECNFSLKNGHCVKISFDDVISRKKDARFHLSLFNKKSKNITNELKEFNLKLWMVMKNGHGHGSDEVVMKKNKGSIQFTNVWFLMLGQWHMKLTYKFDGKDFKASIPVCIMKNKDESRLGNCQ